jgi:hypothetical protein
MAPIKAFLAKHLDGCEIIVDPFCGKSLLATHSNDLAMGGIDAVDFCKGLQGLSADAIIFDPPYSPRQISECYKSIGKKVSKSDTQNAALYSKVRKVLVPLLKDGGIALSFGWQSAGFGEEFGETIEILLVQHGGGHNDTICVAQRRNFAAPNHRKRESQ